MNRHLVIIILVLGIVQSAWTQTISRNDDGEMIITFKDGSWRYFTSTDSILMQSEYADFKKAESHIEIDGESGNEAHETQIDKFTEAEKIEIQNPVDDEEILGEDKLEVDLTADEMEILELTERRLTLTERLRRVESGYINLSEKDIKKVKEELIEINSKLNAFSGIEDSQKKVNSYDRNNYVFTPADKKFDDCDISIEQDQFTNKKIAAARRGYFFQYTPEELRSHLKGGHYLDAYASVAHVGGNTILSLFTEIFSKGKQSGYGVLAKGASIRIKLTNGEVITLYNAKHDAGRRNIAEHKYYYTGRYTIDKDSIKRLRKHDIDTIRINWSVGYEDYEVFHVSVIRDQLNCLLAVL